ncbi:N-acetylglucosamine kinase [Rhodococcus marinonascens]|uniref:N-acetylglucosamine kinase n=1 Tax=Rhodococcus marinonascens TaxID=38311 RepID=UPI000ABE348C|nr:BadF/BadG/BcrA/BcrD ATPase family protein [Rhodococcus marinonascens]
MALFLGVDGGGSKTAFVLLDDAARIVAETQGPSCYYFTSGIDLVSTVLADGITRITAEAEVSTQEIDYAFFGLPSYGEASADIAVLESIPKALLGHDRYTCDNDMIGGWAGSLGGADGINIISGTGSMTYGERHGTGYRAGGWGELFGDEGSAYWVAVRGLNAFSRMSDGRLPRGPLYDVVKERVGIGSDLDLIGAVVDDWGGRRSAIADLSKTVVEADARGDRIAAGILVDACHELAHLVDATRVQLGYGGEEPVPVSYSGGMFTAPAYLTGFTAALDALGAQYRLRAPLFGPGIGSALYAMKKHGVTLPSPSLAHLHQAHATRR